MITTNCILQEVVWWFKDALERNPIQLDSTVLGIVGYILYIDYLYASKHLCRIVSVKYLLLKSMNALKLKNQILQT